MAEHSYHHVSSFSFSATGSRVSSAFSHEENNQRQRHLPSNTGAVRAEWRAWPQQLLMPLRIVHNLCSDDDSVINDDDRGNQFLGWIPALRAAIDSYVTAIPALTTTIETDACQPIANANLTHVVNALHVVYGTCGADCCGKTDVEYKYRLDAQGNVVIIRYSGLIRLDPACFAASASDGTNNDDSPQKNKNTVDRAKQYLICHELGHALTLGHNNHNPDSCMGDYDPAVGNYLPGTDDLNLINDEIYPFSATTIDESKKLKGGEESSPLRTNQEADKKSDIILIEPNIQPRDSSVAQPLNFEESRGDGVELDGLNRARPLYDSAHKTDYSCISVGEEEEGEIGRISGAGIAIVCLSLVTLLALLVIAFVLFWQRSNSMAADLCERGDGRSKKTLETATPANVSFEAMRKDDDAFNDNA